VNVVVSPTHPGSAQDTMMKSLTRLATTLTLMLALAGLQVQPLLANAVPVPGQGGAVTTCSAPYITATVIVWNPDGSGTRTTCWSQTCTTTFAGADGTTTVTTVTVVTKTRFGRTRAKRTRGPEPARRVLCFRITGLRVNI
jgi:hypothetical protein